MKRFTHTITGFFKLKAALLVLSLIFFSSAKAQYHYEISHEDSLALEDVIVEKYYVADSADYADTTGGLLPKGAVTYRIYIDMRPGYKLQVVSGYKNHELVIKTTTTFFNNTYINAATGFNVSTKAINDNTVALDSWITMGAATRNHMGVLLSEDKDGSVIKRNALQNKDGLTFGNLPVIKTFNLDMGFFAGRKDASVFSTKNGGWAALGGGGVQGSTPKNRVLIAQLTTDGLLSFELNVQIGTPKKGWVHFVAKNPEGDEIQFKKLSYN